MHRTPSFLLHRLAAAEHSASPSDLQLADGEVVFHQGQPCRDVYVLRSGYLKLVRLDATGAASITALLNAGELVGPGLGSSATATHTAIARGTVRLRRYSGHAFRARSAADPELANAVITMLAHRHEIFERRLHAILRLGVRGRIAVVLNDLISHYGGRCRHGHEVDIPLTQQELGEFVGASRPVVSSIFNQFRRDGWLDYARGHICIDDREQLARLAGEMSSR